MTDKAFPGTVVPLPGTAPPPESESTLEVSSQLQAFLATLNAMDESYFIETVPGLGGGWQAKWVRKGLAMKAIAIHWSGEILALSRGPQADELFRQRAWADRHGSRARIQYQTSEIPRVLAEARAAARRTIPPPPLEEF